jgi:hypothetical protein
MKPEDIQKLLGGYATGTLTPEEQQALFAAALDDQQLFDALAKDQSLRDLLRDPSARAQVLAAIDDHPLPWWKAHRWVLAGATVAATLAVATGVYLTRPKPIAPLPPVLVAQSEQPEPPTSPVPAARPPAPPMKRKAVAKPVAPAVLPPVQQPSKESVNVSATSSQIKVDGSPPPPENARALFYNPPASNTLLGGAGGAAPAPSQSQQQPVLQSQQRLDANGPARPLTAATFAVPNPGVKWTALRKQPDGLFTEVDPDQIKAGDIIKLRVVPNDRGFISVMEGAKPVVTERPVQRLQPFETPELTGEGKKDLTVLLSRSTSEQSGIIHAQATTGQLKQADKSENAVYEVKTNANPTPPLVVKITLNFQ